MDVQVDATFIRLEREKRAWSQEHLAGAAGIGVRTIQRIEATGVASYESVRAISAALEIPVARLRRGDGLQEVIRVPRPRLARLMRWVGAAAALAVFALSTGFFLLKDYQKVRVLRTVEQWVTDSQPSFVHEPTNDGL
jgi:transcriptional regulator with XRE-family HTH domain